MVTMPSGPLKKRTAAAPRLPQLGEGDGHHDHDADDQPLVNVGAAS